MKLGEKLRVGDVVSVGWAKSYQMGKVVRVTGTGRAIVLWDDGLETTHPTGLLELLVEPSAQMGLFEARAS